MPTRFCIVYTNLSYLFHEHAGLKNSANAFVRGGLFIVKSRCKHVNFTCTSAEETVAETVAAIRAETKRLC